MRNALKQNVLAIIIMLKVKEAITKLFQGLLQFIRMQLFNE